TVIITSYRYSLLYVSYIAQLYHLSIFSSSFSFHVSFQNQAGIWSESKMLFLQPNNKKSIICSTTTFMSP
ncbi:MAG: hypothetical protein MUO76_09880, partial [Anaerolineaceae bacterium]|nr:hypothetical protein [Anaerolineaceae bacterium]